MEEIIILRREIRLTKQGEKYGVVICNCKLCNKELPKTKNCLKKWSGFCKNCANKYNRNAHKLKSRICKTCNLEQDISQFVSKNTKYSKLVCSKCCNLKKYGINYKEYLQLLEKQNGVCAICFNPETSSNNKVNISSLAVDHCHITGKVRGLLCQKCNQAIGLLKDNKVLLQNAINYLS